MFCSEAVRNIEVRTILGRNRIVANHQRFKHTYAVYTVKVNYSFRLIFNHFAPCIS